MKSRKTHLVVWLAFALGLGAARGQDLQTSFEFQPGADRFTVGQCPKCAIFRNGAALPSQSGALTRSGGRSWMVAPGETGAIVLEQPTHELRLFFKDENEAVQSVLTLYDEQARPLLITNGSSNGPDVNGFSEVYNLAGSVKTITLENRSSAGGSGGYAVIDDLEATLAESPLTLVDTLYVPRFGDGTFMAGGVSNTLITEGVFTNTGSYARVSVDAFTDDGNPVMITVEDSITGNRSTDTTFSFDLSQGQSAAVSTVGLGNFVVGGLVVPGYWRVRVERPESGAANQAEGVGAGAVYSRFQTLDRRPVRLFETAVPAVRPIREFSLFLDSTGERDTGLALLNPPSDGEGGQAEVLLEVWDIRYETLLATARIALPQGQAVSKFIWEYVRDYGVGVDQAVIAQLRETRAAVTVQSDRPLAATALRQDNPNATLPQGVPTLTSFQVTPGSPR